MTHLPIAQANVPDHIIDFGVGQPGFDLLPLELIRKAAAHRLAGDDPAFLNYGIEQGDATLRLELACFLSQRYGCPVALDDLFMTAGASDALDLICTLFTRPGEVIYAEEPSYFLALRIFSDHGLTVRGVPIDDAGMDIDVLEAMLATESPRLLYTIPTFQNPTGVTLSAARRQRLVELAEKHDFLIVADEVYQLLNYTADPPPPLAAYTDSGRVLSVGSFSKILAPGLRLGWVQAASPLIQRFISCGLLDSGGGLNPFTSAIIRSMLSEGWQDEHLAQLQATYRDRVAALDEALQVHLGERIAYRRPDGGFFFWLTLPDGLNAADLLPAAREHGVGFQPGVKFSSVAALEDQCRLSFAFYSEEKLVEGAFRFAQVVL